MAGELGLYTRICCEIDNMPTWAKAAVGTTGIIIAGASGVGAAAIAEAVIASAGISAATDGAFYSIYALNNGSFSKSELKDTVINGAANGYMFAGAGLGVAGIRNAAKSGKLAGVMADEAGSVSYEGGRTSGKVWDYSKQFDSELANFNAGYKIKNVIDKDLYIVQFHSNAEVGNGRSLKYWTTFDEANGISTVDDYMNQMALLSNWGARDNVSIAKISAGTKIKYAIGTAREQVGAIESRPGGGLQILFEQFDDGWVLETRPLP